MIIFRYHIILFETAHFIRAKRQKKPPRQQPETKAKTQQAQIPWQGTQQSTKQGTTLDKTGHNLITGKIHLSNTNNNCKILTVRDFCWSHHILFTMHSINPLGPKFLMGSIWVFTGPGSWKWIMKRHGWQRFCVCIRNTSEFLQTICSEPVVVTPCINIRPSG